jgi:hypothetical protein
MNSVRIRLSGALVSALSVLALGFGGAAGVQAAPADAPVGPAAAATLSLNSLGFGSSLGFYGLQAETTLSIPVPVGLTPAALTAVVDLPPYILSGGMTVIQDDRTISHTDLPSDRSPITIALAGTRVVDNAVTIRLRVNLTPVLDNCLFDPANPLRLNDVAISFGGLEAIPSTVAEFLPPVLHRLTVFIPSKPSQVESDAAVKLATSVVAHYGRQNTTVAVAALDGATVPPLPAAPFERQVFIREGTTPGITLQPGAGMPSLLITGPAGAIANQVRLVTSDLSRLALSSKAVVGPLTTVAQLPTNLTTIRDLGQPGVNATALTNPRVSIPLDQTRLGRAARSLRVHLEGSYTPLPSTLGGQVTVRVGDDTLTRWPADSSGSIDRWVDVPDRLLTRFTNLDVAVEAAGNTGRCGEFQPITLTIDGATEVQSQLADPPSPLGFQSLPQALMPKVLVGMKGPNAFADTVRAVQIMVGLQHLSERPLGSEVVPFDEAAGAQVPAVLIAADGWDRHDIALPVTAGATGPLTVAGSDGKGGAATLTLDPAQPFGSLQTLYTGGRTVLVATSNGSAAQLDSLLGWLDSDARHWPDLDGTAVVAMPGHPPVVVRTDTGQPPAPSGQLPGWVPWLGGGVLVVLVGAALYTVWRRRRAAH